MISIDAKAFDVVYKMNKNWYGKFILRGYTASINNPNPNKVVYADMFLTIHICGNE